MIFKLIKSHVFYFSQNYKKYIYLFKYLRNRFYKLNKNILLVLWFFVFTKINYYDKIIKYFWYISFNMVSKSLPWTANYRTTKNKRDLLGSEISMKFIMIEVNTIIMPLFYNGYLSI